MQKINKFSFYLYIAIILHLVGFIIFLPENNIKITRLMKKLMQDKKTLNLPAVNNIIVESYQKSDEKPKQQTPFVSENFNPSRGNITQERGYNVTKPSSQENTDKMNEKNVFKKQIIPKNEDNPDIILKKYTKENKPLLNIPRLKTKEHDRFILNFDESGKPSFNTRAFPNVKYFINIAKTCWQYLVHFAPTNSISIGAIKNSAVLVAFKMNRKGEILKIWIHDSTDSQTLNSLSVRAIEFVRENVGSFGKQPPQYDIKVVYTYFYIGRNYTTYGDEKKVIPIKLKGAFYFEYKKLNKKKK